MIKILLHKRVTHHFDGGWVGLDESSFLTSAKLTAPRITSKGNGHDVGRTHTQRARVPKGFNREDIMAALQFAMGGTNCRHEHDCCGCSTRYVDVKPMGARDFFVHTSVHFNY
ncbi:MULTISPECIES: hypothetical protein [unclassified Hydrogenophaga]|jgi:hypothetical protein|uniref:hypothetical protein n=1 Tax=unclassified Hydrogenophaga TaxID=2610897 RepID=UPI0013202B69|nr:MULTISPECIES: hypothetical protein [unclassified Hydrogenophaga]MDP3351720.1 hypothetical protein [Hydrogenophaga sp.]QHE78797.1 hypothetical protein F9Z45_21980 [Hydrogenophaga sp. PBL-H3]QHE83222.1 hypothetical protein F9Z44_21980 [Hydrogenophaga sp. PBL-H3]